MKFYNRFIPLFLVVYIIVSYIPFLEMVFSNDAHKKMHSEIFPFFSYPLYMRVKTDFTENDILINLNEEDEHFFFYKNKSYSKFERTIRIKGLDKIVLSTEDDKKEKIIALFPELLDTQNAYLIEITGNYVDAIKKNQFDFQIIEKIN